MNPESISATLGDADACGNLGAAASAQLSTYMVYWTKTDGAMYLNLPPLEVDVTGTVEVVNVAGAVTCALGGRSVPIIVSASAIPHTGVDVSMGVVPVEEATPDVNLSAGLTPDTTVVTLSLDNEDGVLGFACDAAATGTQLNYVLAGTDADSFRLSSTAATVTTMEALAAVANPPLTITVDEAGSTPAATVVTGLCPGLGSGWMFLHPVESSAYDTADATTRVMMASKDEVTAAMDSVDAAADAATGQLADMS